jgi:hypothetical protein
LLTSSEIADEFTMSANTVKSHVRSRADDTATWPHRNGDGREDLRTEGPGKPRRQGHDIVRRAD